MKLTIAMVLLAGCSIATEERRGATDTTEAQLPASPELYDDAEFERASDEITRHDDAERKLAKARADEPDAKK